MNLVQTNIITNANEATVKQDLKTLQDELDLYIANEYANTLGKFKAEDLDVTNKTEIAKIIPSIKDTKYENYVTIEDGKIAISDLMTELEKIWAMEVLGATSIRTDSPIETVTPVIAIDTIVTTSNSSITG